MALDRDHRILWSNAVIGWRNENYEAGHDCYIALTSVALQLTNWDRAWYWSALPSWADGGWYDSGNGNVHLDRNRYLQGRWAEGF